MLLINNFTFLIDIIKNIKDMNYEKKYKELTNGWLKCVDDIDDKYPQCNDFEKCVIVLRSSHWNYGDIQKALGNPSKKEIRKVLVKWAPELIDNSIKKVLDTSTNWNSLLYEILLKQGKVECLIDEEFIWTFYIKDFRIICVDDCGFEVNFQDLDERTQHQFYNLIKNKINEV